MLATTEPPQVSLWSFMIENHRHLNKLFQRVLLAFEANDVDAGVVWTELEHGVLSHMDAEERFVLPAFARVDRDEAHALLRQHGRIREQLLELGIALDLHHLRVSQSRDLIATLQAHAIREDHLLYRWADARLDASVAAAARRHLHEHRIWPPSTPRTACVTPAR